MKRMSNRQQHHATKASLMKNLHMFDNSSDKIYQLEFISQFSSVAQSCPTLCDPMNHNTPGLPVHHQLPEFTQTHVHWVIKDLKSRSYLQHWKNQRYFHLCQQLYPCRQPLQWWSLTGPGLHYSQGCLEENLSCPLLVHLSLFLLDEVLSFC